MNLTLGKRDKKGAHFKEQAPIIEGIKSTPEKKRKAIVQYRHRNGKNEVLGLTGFLTVGEIKTIGSEVYQLWYISNHQMYPTSLGCVYCKGAGCLRVGQIYSDEDFSAIITEMKACGKALSQIIKDVRAAELAEIRTIEI